MSKRLLPSRFFAPLLALAIVAPLPGQRQASTIPRSAGGHPDLQGIWTNATLTPLERPAAFAGKLSVSDAEAAAYEQKQIDELKAGDGKSDSDFHRRAGSGETGGYNALFIDRGSELARVDGVKRMSLIIDPPDGKVPPLTPEARARLQSLRRGGIDSVQERPLAERCLMSFGSSSGPPMLPVLYNNNYQIVQTPGAVMILVEMIHDARIVRMNAAHDPDNIRKWLGDSIGHWEGNTLVVDTINFNEHINFRGSSQNLHVIERFTRVDANTLLYRATIDDPTTFTKSWTLEYPFRASNEPIYEYACHEGNYAIEDILGGARKAEQEPQKK
ncbi:MAG TPA: hypothetical protein VGV35_02185 [Bryobacteraceae bacterium]|nr:hypothetical protein [Bryobacteraceae bacterium]